MSPCPFLSADTQQNGYRYVIDAQEGEVAFELISGDTTTVLMAVEGISIIPWATYELEVDVSGTGFTFFLNGTQVMFATDNTYTSGYAGLHASSRADFDSVWYMVDAGDCSGVVEPNWCQMTCNTGYIPSGNLTLTCIDYPPPVGPSNNVAWSSAPGRCALPPPAISNVTVTVPESCLTLPGNLQTACATRSMAVGAPLAGAGSVVPDMPLSYNIVGGNTATVNGITYPAVFYIDNCGGQLFVNQPAGIVFAATPVFRLLVSVTYTDAAAAASAGVVYATITVAVQPVAQPPQLPANQTVFMHENSLPGAATNTSVSFTGSAANCTWALVTDYGAGGRFVVDATTGVIRVAPNNTLSLNYEVPPSVFQVELRVSLNSAPSAFSTGMVTIVLTDVDDPPMFTGMTYYVNDTSARVGYAFSPSLIPWAFYDEDTNPRYRGTPNIFESPPIFDPIFCPFLTNPNTVPTTDGTVGGTSLFAPVTVNGNQTIGIASMPAVGEELLYTYVFVCRYYD